MVNPAYSRPSGSEGRPSLRLVRGAAVTSDHAAGFAQIPAAIIMDPDLSPYAFRVYAIIRAHDFGRGGGCYVSRAEMARMGHMSESSVIRGLAELREKGYIMTVQSTDGASPSRHFCADTGVPQTPPNGSHTDTGVPQSRGGCPTDTSTGVPQTPKEEDWEVEDVKYKTGAAAAPAHEEPTPQRATEGTAEDVPRDDPIWALALGLYVANGGDSQDPDLRVVRRHLKAAKLAIDDLGAAHAADLAGTARWLGTKPTLSRVTMDMAREDRGKWIKLGRPTAYQEPARRTRAAAGREPPGPPPTEVETGGICYGCLATEGWPHKKHCARSGRVSNDNLVSWEEKNGRPHA